MLTFNHKWLEPIKSGNVSVVFRKTWLNRENIDWLYAYFTAPTSAVAAKLRIDNVNQHDVSIALDLCEDGQIDRAELESYSKDYEKLFVIRVSDVRVMRTPVPQALLTKDYGFWPSSTFIPISRFGEQQLDEMGQIEESQQ